MLRLSLFTLVLLALASCSSQTFRVLSYAEYDPKVKDFDPPEFVEEAYFHMHNNNLYYVSEDQKLHFKRRGAPSEYDGITYTEVRHNGNVHQIQAYFDYGYYGDKIVFCTVFDENRKPLFQFTLDYDNKMKNQDFESQIYSDEMMAQMERNGVSPKKEK